MTAIDVRSGLDLPLDGRVFMYPKSFAVRAIACFIFFVAMTVWGTWRFAHPDGSLHERELAVMSGCVFGGMTLLSLYVLVAWRKEKLFLSPMLVRLTSLFTDRTVAFAEITRAQWRYSRRDLVLHTRSRRIKVSVASYGNWRDLCALLRGSVPSALQDGYEQFEIRWLIARPPTVVKDGIVWRITVGSLFVAGILAAWNSFGAAVIAWNLLAFISLPIAVIMTIDALRRRTGFAAILFIIAWLVVAVLFLVGWHHFDSIFFMSNRR